MKIYIANKTVSIKKDPLQLIDERADKINFELENYDSPFVLKEIDKHLKSSFKYIYFKEKEKELLFLKELVLSFA
jgi:hypothetical protein